MRMRLTVHDVIIAVYKGAGEHNMSAEIRCLLRAVAGLSHLVLYSIYFLHWGVTGVTCGWYSALKVWQVSVHQQKTLKFN